jgi:16S rRNA (cytosine967-C5)-methyltransferase
MHAQSNQLPSLWLQSLRGLFDTTLFREGLFRVQDWSAQQLARLLGASRPQGLQSCEGERIDVLDVCAAPGGKTFLIAEDPRTRVWAMDKSKRRLQKMKTEAERLSKTLDLSRLTVTAADVLGDVWPNGFPDQFDRIVLDAPCSASGVISRHPEIAWTNRLAERESLCAVQSAMLNAVWQRLKPGGELLYVTCSVFHAEGEQQIDAFLRVHPDAMRQAAPGYILPTADAIDHGPGCDGFFYASLFRDVQP